MPEKSFTLQKLLEIAGATKELAVFSTKLLTRSFPSMYPDEIEEFCQKVRTSFENYMRIVPPEMRSELISDEELEKIDNYLGKIKAYTKVD